jgi:hypothetical protein
MGPLTDGISISGIKLRFVVRYVILIVLSALSLTLPALAGRCTGSASCSVCSNCSRCAHCGAGGTCGVCASYSSGSSSGSSSRSYPAYTPPASPRPTKVLPGRVDNPTNYPKAAPREHQADECYYTNANGEYTCHNKCTQYSIYCKKHGG